MERTRKEKLLPEIKDWKDPQNKYRYANVNDLTYSQWFWFHPSAYKLLNYGINVIGICLFTPLLFWLAMRGNYFFMLIPTVLLGSNILNFIKKVRKGQIIPKDSNFYDFHMREYC